MATSHDYFLFILELLRETSGITYKKMMGEYILYKDGVIFGGVYDNRFLMKKTKALEEEDFKEVIPYPSAKPMYLIDSEDSEYIAELVTKTIKSLHNK